MLVLAGTSDPYVKGTLGAARFTTGVVHKTLAPKWEREVYELPVEDWTREECYMLKLRVRDYDKFSSDDELGFCQIDLRSMRGGLPQTVWQDLQEVDTGSLCVRVTIKDDVGLSAEERQQLFETKRQEEALRAKKLANILRTVGSEDGANQVASGQPQMLSPGFGFRV